MDSNNNKIRNIVTRVLLIALCTTLIIWVLPHENASKWTYDVNRPWNNPDLISDIDFPIIKDSDDLKKEIDDLVDSYEPYYIYDETVVETQLAELDTLMKEHPDSLPARVVSRLKTLLCDVYDTGVIDDSLFTSTSKDTLKNIRIINGKEVSVVHLSQIFSSRTAFNKITTDPDPVIKENAWLCKDLIQNLIKPNMQPDVARNTEETESLRKSVATYNGVVNNKEKIVGRGEIITKNIYQKIVSYEEAKNQRKQEVTSIPKVISGQIIYVLMMIGLMTIYLLLFRKDYFEKPRILTLLYLLVATFPVIVSMMMRHPFLSVYVIPFAILPMFVRVFMDSRTAFMAHVIMILICAVAVKYQYEFIIVQIVAGTIAIYSMRHLTKRSEVFMAALYITLSTCFIYFALQLIQDQPAGTLDRNIFLHIAVNGVLLLFAYPAMYIIEKLFGFTSDVTLIELSNTSNKLLRQMSMVAPGTYQHCTMVSNLCAEIAEKIDAQPQLVRTGALYHDIGKITNPENFTENQRTSINPLATKDRKEAAKIIISHVTQGVKLAQREGLPEEIIDFIRTHHGRGTTKYFLINYKNEHPNEEIDVKDFSYAGPNPQTREQAILMMADAVEAASRSLQEYTEENITNLVNGIIDSQVSDKLYAECPINFRDINNAKAVLIERLMAIYHTRIAYPKEGK